MTGAFDGANQQEKHSSEDLTKIVAGAREQDLAGRDDMEKSSCAGHRKERVLPSLGTKL